MQTIDEFKTFNRNFTDDRLAVLFGVDVSTIYRWRHGKTHPPKAVEIAIAALTALPRETAINLITQFRR